MNEIVGYFAWVRTQRGQPACEKYGDDRVGIDRTAKLRTLVEHPLTAEQFGLSLNQLAVKFPCPPPTEKDDK